MSYQGDYSAGDVINWKFASRSSAGPTALSSGAVSIYKDASTTPSTAGVTLTSTFASVTGMNHVSLATTADSTFYADGSQFEAVLSAGAVNSVSVIGEVIGRFTLRAQAPLYPTTAGRKLDVSSGGEAGVDWANVGSPTTTVNLSGTTVKTATDVETDTQDIQSKIGTPSNLGGGATLANNNSDMAGATFSSATDSQEAVRDHIGNGSNLTEAGGTGDHLTAIPWNAAWDAEVQSECTDALNAYDPPTNTEMVAAFTEIKGATWATTDTLEAIRDRGDAAWITATGFSTLDAAGIRTAVGLASANLDTQLGTIDSNVDAVLDDTGTTGVKVATGGIGAGAHASAELNAIADAFLDRNMATGTDSGTDSTAVRTPRQALRASRNKVTIAAGTMTVTKEDDSTTSWTAGVTTAAGNPISEVDPS